MANEIVKKNVQIKWEIVDPPDDKIHNLVIARCPVCEGNGLVPAGFYNQIGGQWSASQTTEKCRSCDGKGYVMIELSDG